MSLETFKKMVDQCIKFPEKIKFLRFIGIGEPLLNKNLPQMIDYAKKSGVFEKIEITSNGTLLKPDLSDRLLDSGLDILRVSLEATDDERFYEISGVQMNMKDIKENIKYFFDKRKNCILYIKTNDIALKNETEKQAFFTEYDGICDYIFVENVVPIWPDFEIDMTLNAETRFGRGESDQHSVCIQPFKLLCVTADGGVIPCSADWKRYLTLGNLNETTLPEIWHGDILKELRIGLLDGESNKQCSICNFQRVNESDNIDIARKEIKSRLVTS
jgi:radical SAM protein with 4Fe4S-binding SPASM domain